jgi:hypothetical protein
LTVKRPSSVSPSATRPSRWVSRAGSLRSKSAGTPKSLGCAQSASRERRFRYACRPPLAKTRATRRRWRSFRRPIHFQRPRHGRRLGFFTFIQWGDRPTRYGRSRCLETRPSSPMLQAARNRSGPISPCSNGAMKMPSLRRLRSRARLALRIESGSGRISSPSPASISKA